jgi:protein-tyrosine phosphatase
MDAFMEWAAEARRRGITRAVMAIRAAGGPGEVPEPWLHILRKELLEKGIRLALGACSEVSLTSNTDLNRQARLNRLTTMGSARAILLELPVHILPKSCSPVIEELRDGGFTPVLVHPERNWTIQSDPRQIQPLIGAGARVCIAAASLGPGSPPGVVRATQEALAEGLVEAMASDYLGTSAPYVWLDEGLELAAQLIGETAAWRLVTANVQAILFGGAPKQTVAVSC